MSNVPKASTAISAVTPSLPKVATLNDPPPSCAKATDTGPSVSVKTSAFRPRYNFAFPTVTEPMTAGFMSLSSMLTRTGRSVSSVT